MKNALLLLALTIFCSSSAIASRSLPSALAVVAARSTPEPIDNTVSFDIVKERWDAGTLGTWTTMQGNWRAVASVSHVGCTDLIETIVNEGGIKNSDGSLRGYLFFQWLNLSDFPGDEKRPTFVVNILNMGYESADQGPYRVRPSAPQFSSWANGGKSRTAHYPLSCRMIGGSGRSMICLMTFKDMREDSATTSERICAQQAYAGAMVYVKDPR